MTPNPRRGLVVAAGLTLPLIVLCPTVANSQAKGNPAMPCYRSLADDPRFASIREKLVLGPASSSETQRVARITERASASEKNAISAWRRAREDCHKLENPYFATRDAEIQAKASRYFAAVQALIGELEEGKLSYDDFGKRRMDLYDQFDRDVGAIRKGITPPNLPPRKNNAP